MSIIWNQGEVFLMGEDGVIATTIDPWVSEYVAKSCHIEVESTEPWRFHHGQDMVPLIRERRTKITFELENGETLIVHLQPALASPANSTFALVIDDLIVPESEEAAVDLDGIL